MSFTIKYIPIDVSEQPKEFQLFVGEFVTVNELKGKIEEYLRPKAEEDPNNDWIEPFLTTVYNKSSIDLINEERFVKTQGNDKQNMEIVAYEREPLSMFNFN